MVPAPESRIDFEFAIPGRAVRIRRNGPDGVRLEIAEIPRPSESVARFLRDRCGEQ